MSGQEHLTDRELADVHADPEVTRQLGILVANGELDVATAVMWLEDDILTRQDGVVRND